MDTEPQKFFAIPLIDSVAVLHRSENQGNGNPVIRTCYMTGNEMFSTMIAASQTAASSMKCLQCGERFKFFQVRTGPTEYKNNTYAISCIQDPPFIHTEVLRSLPYAHVQRSLLGNASS